MGRGRAGSGHPWLHSTRFRFRRPRRLSTPMGDPVLSTLPEPPGKFLIGAWLATAVLLLLVLHFDLLPAMLAGLLVFELVHVLTLRLNFVRERRARLLAVAFLAAVIVGLL